MSTISNEIEWKENKKKKLKDINKNPVITDEDLDNLINAMWEFNCLVQVHMEINETIKELRKDVMVLEE